MEKDLKELVVSKVEGATSQLTQTATERFILKSFDEIKRKSIGSKRTLAFYHPAYKNVTYFSNIRKT